MLDVLKPFAASALRGVLQAGAGVLATHGLISSSGTEQFVGAGLMIGSFVWSWYEKRGRVQLAQALDDARALLHARAQQARQAGITPVAPLPAAVAAEVRKENAGE
jgi:hypothetical protein